ncbi:MAG: 6-bladed beta-propeller [Bacteroidaceae bacterium]|nr:6-bladed beta-propeller [Bacteroidaceae bacterium]
MRRILYVVCTAVAVVACILTDSCANVQDEAKDLTKVDATKWDNNSDSHFASTRIIPLETGEDFLMGDIVRIMVYDDTYYILDSGKRIFLFDMDGKFISKIDRQGRGHGEYIDANCFDVQGDEVYILSSFEKKIRVYSFEGEFLREIGLDGPYFDMAVEDDYILLYSDNNNESHKNFVKISHEGEVMDSWDDFDKITSYMTGGRKLNRQGSSIFYFKPFDYRIFEYDGQTSRLIAEFLFTNNIRYKESDMDDIVAFSEKVMNTEYVKSFSKAAKVGNLLVVTYQMFLDEYGIRDFMIIKNLTDGKCYNYCLQEQGLCSIPFPGYGYYLCDKALITYTSASGFLMANGNSVDEEILSGISADGNPVLMRFDFKTEN